MTTISRRKALALIGASAASVALLPSLSLASGKTIICNWDKRFPPYSMERGGRMTGILVECMDELLGKRMGYTLVHKGYVWPTAQNLVQTGRADSLCTNATDERRQYMVFTEEPVIESLPSIFCAVDNPRRNEIEAIATLADLKNFRQVDYRGNGWAKRTFTPDHAITYVDDLSSVFELIAQGQADIFVGNGLAAMYTVKRMGLTNKIHARELAVGEPSRFHFGLRKDFPDAQAIVDAFTETLFEAQVDEATRKIILHYL